MDAGGRTFTIVGIGRLRGIGPGAESLVYLDYATLRERAGLGDVMTTIVIDTRQPTLVRERVAANGALSVADRQNLLDRVKQAQATSVAVNWTVSLLALGLGALAGLLPARRALGVDPVEILREA